MRHVFCPSLLLAAAVVLAGGCAARELRITSNPGGAAATVDGVPAGLTPTKYKFDFGKKTYYDVSVAKTGYLPMTQTVVADGEVANGGVVAFDLAPDQAYSQTTVSEAANNWMRIQVNGQFTREQAWQRMVDSVTTRYSNLEQLDQASGYLRSVPMTRTYKHPSKGEFSVRTYFVGTIAQAEPLVYKVKVTSEYSDVPGVWQPYERVFTGDQQLVEELQNRLGIK